MIFLDFFVQNWLDKLGNKSVGNPWVKHVPFSTNVWGPSPVETINHHHYYVSFTNDYSRYTHIVLLSIKDETFKSYKDFKAWAKTQHNINIKCLHSDRGGEYLSSEFRDHIKSQGTEHCLTTHDTPEHNGVVESLNRRLLEHTHAMLHNHLARTLLVANGIFISRKMPLVRLKNTRRD